MNEQTGEIFTKVVFDREKQAAYALEVEARDGAPSARPNSNNLPNTGTLHDSSYSYSSKRTSILNTFLRFHFNKIKYKFLYIVSIFMYAYVTTDCFETRACAQTPPFDPGQLWTIRRKYFSHRTGLLVPIDVSIDGCSIPIA